MSFEYKFTESEISPTVEELKDLLIVLEENQHSLRKELEKYNL